MTYIVPDPPRILNKNPLVGATPGGDVTLRCEVEAYPRPIIVWYHEPVSNMSSSSYAPRGKTLIMSGERHEQEDVSESLQRTVSLLHIRGVSAAQAGKYHCQAENSLGTVHNLVRVYSKWRKLTPF